MIGFDGLTPMEATVEYAEATKQLVRLLKEAGIIPVEMIPGWVGGAMVTALVEELNAE